MKQYRPCSVDGCKSVHYGKTFCARHYRHFLYHGNPIAKAHKSDDGHYAPKDPAIRLWKRVVKSETCWIWNGYKDRDGYGTLKINKRNVFVHRFAYELLIGPIPTGLQIDHLCFVRSVSSNVMFFDVRKLNLI